MLGLALIASISGSQAFAQLDGPAPLAWRWTQSTVASPAGSPLVDGNTIYVAVGQRIYALDLETGNQKWKFPLVDPIDGYFRQAPIRVGNLIVAYADNKTIYAVDMVTGEKKWQHLAEGTISAGMVPVGDRVIAYGMSDGSLNTIFAESGMNVLSKPIQIDGGYGGRIASYLNTVLIPTGLSNLIQVDAVTGKIIKSRSFTNFAGDTRPVVFGDTIYLNSNAYVIALGGADLRPRWQRNCGDFVSFAPAAGPSGVALQTRDGKAMILNPVNGIPSFNIDLASQPATSPAIVGSNFLFTTLNGVMTLVDGKTGLVKWIYQIRPVVKFADNSQNPGGAGGGGRNGGPGGGGMMLGGGAQGNPASQEKTRIVSVPAAGPPVLAGSTLLVLTKDASLLAFDKDNGVDLTPPVVDLTFPKQGQWYSSQRGLELFFTIDDEASGLRTDSVEVMVDGEKKAFKLGRDGVLNVRFGAANANGILMDGRRVITIRCKDWLGNEIEKSFSLLIDNTLPPVQVPKSLTGPDGRSGGGGGGAGNGGDGR